MMYASVSASRGPRTTRLLGRTQRSLLQGALYLLLLDMRVADDGHFEAVLKFR